MDKARDIQDVTSLAPKQGGFDFLWRFSGSSKPMNHTNQRMPHPNVLVSRFRTITRTSPLRFVVCT